MKNITKVVKLVIIGFLLMLFFHPVATIFFIVTHLGILTAIGIIYSIIRIALGMSIISFITKTLQEEDD